MYRFTIYVDVVCMCVCVCLQRHYCTQLPALFHRQYTHHGCHSPSSVLMNNRWQQYSNSQRLCSDGWMFCAAIRSLYMKAGCLSIPAWASFRNNGPQSSACASFMCIYGSRRSHFSPNIPSPPPQFSLSTITPHSPNNKRRDRFFFFRNNVFHSVGLMDNLFGSCDFYCSRWCTIYINTVKEWLFRSY